MARRRRKKSIWSYQQKRRARLQRVLRAIGRILFLVILVGAAVAALTIFFKVDTIEIEGYTRYSDGEIIAGLDVKEGDNLYLWDKITTSEHLLQKFPYLDTVQIRRRLPDALVVTVTEAKAVLAVASDTGYYLLSDKGKVLELSDKDNGLPKVNGVSLLGYAPGQIVTHTSDAYADALLTTLDALLTIGMLDGVDFINLQSLTDIRVGYLERFDIRVGTVDEVSYRLRFAYLVTEERLSPSDIGRLYWDTKNRLHFVPDTAENVARSGLSLNSTDPAGTVVLPGDGENPDDTGQPDGDGTENPDDGTQGDSPEDDGGDDYDPSEDDMGDDDGYYEDDFDDSGDHSYSDGDGDYEEDE